MIKKRIAIFFILFANIIFLAHSAIPHHHHKNQVCIDSSHCESDNAAHTHEASESDHEHDGNNDSEYCSLKQLILVRPEQLKQGNNFDYNLFGYISTNALQTDFSNKISDSFSSESVTKRSILIEPFSYTCLVRTSSGLRAPPMI